MWHCFKRFFSPFPCKDGFCMAKRDMMRLAGLALLILSGLGLRIYRLGDQSAWCDEAQFFALSAQDLRTFLDIIRFWGPDNVLLYYAVFYWWNHLLGISLVSARMLTILAGVACIPLVYALGRRIFDERAGWIAATLTALSPFQIWHSQSMRPYGLCVPLALLAMYAVVRVGQADAAGKGAWGWWVTAFAANCLLMWTHVFMVLLIPVQATCLLGMRQRGFLRAAYWALADAPVVGMVYLWLRPRMHTVPEAEFDHFYLPGIRQVFVDLFGDDVTQHSGEFPIALPQWLTRMPHHEVWVMALGVALMLFLLVAAVFSLRLVRRRWAAGDIGPALLLSTALAPTLALAALSYAWRPCLETRYTPYANLALMLIAAGVLSQAGSVFLRRALVSLLMLLMAFQSVLFVFGVSRTQWLAAARYIAAEQQPDDIILVKGVVHWARDTFMANQNNHDIPVIGAHTIASVCDKTCAYFEVHRAEQAEEPPGVVWAVLELPFFEPARLQDIFRQRLGPLGIQASYLHYPGMQGLLLCRFAQKHGQALSHPVPWDMSYSRTDYAGILADIGLGHLTDDTRESAVRALGRVLDIPFPPGKNNYALMSVLLMEEGEYDLAEQCAFRSITLMDNYGFGHFALGLSLAARDDIGKAMQALGRAFALDRVLENLFRPLVEALYEKGDAAAAAREMRRLAPMGFPYVALQRLFAARFPEAGAPDPGLSAADPLLRSTVCTPQRFHFPVVSAR